MRPRQASHGLLILILLLSLLGCGKAQDSTPAPDSEGDDEPSWSLDDLGGACDTSVRIGGFEIAQWESYDPPFSTVSGVVRDGVVPTLVSEPKESAGDCTLWQKQNPFCDPPCEPGEACSLESVCVPYPLQQDVGEVSVTGLEASVSMSPDTSNNYWTTSVPYPLFGAGDLVRLDATGWDGLSLRGLGVEPLVADTAWVLESGADLEISWTPGAGESRIVLTLNVDQHGNSPVTLACDAPDTGTLTLDGGLLDRLVQYGTSGFTTSYLFRRTADHVDLEAGCVDLLVYSMLDGDLTLGGSR